MSKKIVTDPFAIPEALQKHWAFHGARMAKRVMYKGHDIFLAEGGPHHDVKNHRVVKHDPQAGELIEEDAWMKKGYYLSAWGIMRGQAVMGSPLYFKLDHDLELTKEGRIKARVESALAAAEAVIDDMVNVGLLDHTEGGIVIPNSPNTFLNRVIH